MHISRNPDKFKNHLTGAKSSGGQIAPALTLRLGHMPPKVYTIIPEYIVRVDILWRKCLQTTMGKGA